LPEWPDPTRRYSRSTQENPDNPRVVRREEADGWYRRSTLRVTADQRLKEKPLVGVTGSPPAHPPGGLVGLRYEAMSRTPRRVVDPACTGWPRNTRSSDRGDRIPISILRAASWKWILPRRCSTAVLGQQKKGGCGRVALRGRGIRKTLSAGRACGSTRRP
jgi:hypothetical protein